MKPILIVIPPHNFRYEELHITEEELEKKGHKTIISSTMIGKCFSTTGGYVNSHLDINKISISDYEAVVFIGGPGVKKLYKDEAALRIARGMNAMGKVVAAICLAPVILANAGLLKHKKATVDFSESKHLEQMGAIYSDTGVVSEGNIITADGPSHTKLFAEAIHKTLKVLV
jgi:protease I